MIYKTAMFLWQRGYLILTSILQFPSSQAIHTQVKSEDGYPIDLRPLYMHYLAKNIYLLVQIKKIMKSKF